MAKKKSGARRSKATQRTGRRYSREAEQERKSRKQFEEVFVAWPANSIEIDLGEDHFVQIYEEGQSTGLSLLVQLKSCKSLGEHLLTGGTVVSYKFEVDDLEHWEDQALPVVLVVWAVDEREGVWVDIAAVVADLDVRVPEWREQETVRVHIPRSNGCDEAGRAALRRRIGKLTLPLMSNRTVTFTPNFEFPDDEAGRAARDALTAAIELGETYTVPGEYITAFKTSAWYERIFGPRPLPDSITISSSASDAAHPVFKIRLSAAGPHRSFDLLSELKRTKAGLRRITMTNEHERVPYAFTLLIHFDEDGEATPEMKFSSSFPGQSVSNALNLTRFLLAMRDGGRASLYINETGPMGEYVAAAESLPPEEELLAWERLLLKLSFVESHLSQFGRFDLTADRSREDFKDLDHIYSFVRYGFWMGRQDVRLGLADDWQVADLPSEDDAPNLEIKWGGGRYEVFGMTIPVAEMTMEVEDYAQVVTAFDKAHREKHNELVLDDILVRMKATWGEPPQRTKRRKRTSSSKKRPKRPTAKKKTRGRRKKKTTTPR